MPIYSRKDAIGQELLMTLNGRNQSEFFVGHEKLRHGSADLQILISSERIIVFSITAVSAAAAGPSPDQEEIFAKDIRPVLTVHHSELVCARIVTSRDLMTSSPQLSEETTSLATLESEKFYVELVLKMLSRFVSFYPPYKTISVVELTLGLIDPLLN